MYIYIYVCVDVCILPITPLNGPQIACLYLCCFQSFAVTLFYEDFYTYVISHMVKFLCKFLEK